MSTYISENTIEEFTIKLLAHNGYEYIYARSCGFATHTLTINKQFVTV